MSTVRASVHPGLTTNSSHTSGQPAGLYVGLGLAIAFLVVCLMLEIYLWTKGWRQTPRPSESVGVSESEIMENIHISRLQDSPTVQIEDNNRRDESTSFERPDQPFEFREKAYSSTGMAKVTIPVQGGHLQARNITLTVGEGCLSKETEITMILDEPGFRNRTFKPLYESGLLKALPLIVECLPRSLKFLKLVALSAQMGKNILNELFILRGSYDKERERIIWNVVVEDVEVNSKEGSVSVKLSCFDTWSYIMTAPENIARILSHLNNSFNCMAAVLYRRIPTFPMIDVAIVLFSEYIVAQQKNDSLLNSIAAEHSYHVGEKSSFKRFDTQRCHEMCIEFPGIKTTDAVTFHVDVPHLDSLGMIVDHFQDVPCEFPARGRVDIYEVHRTGKTVLWSLNIIEIPEQ